MVSWDLAQKRVRKYELKIEELEEDYYQIKKKIEQAYDTYHERLGQFRYMTDIKVQEAMAEFKLLEVEDFSPFINTVEMVSMQVEDEFQQVFNHLDDQRNKLDEAYNKTYRQLDDKLSQAYVERQRASYDGDEKKGAR